MDGEPHQDLRLAADVSELPIELDRGVVARLACRLVVLDENDRSAVDREESCAEHGGNDRSFVEQCLCASPPLCERLRHPEQLERLDELGGEYRLRLGGPVHRGTHVLDLGPNDLEPRGHLLEVHIELRRARDGEHSVRMTRAQRGGALSALVEGCQRELADRLEHPVPLDRVVGRAPAEQALVQQ